MAPANLVQKIPNGLVITVRDLLDHSSGIADYDEISLILREFQDPDVPVPYQAAIEQGIRASPLYPPGTNFTYSNVTYQGVMAVDIRVRSRSGITCRKRIPPLPST